MKTFLVVLPILTIILGRVYVENMTVYESQILTVPVLTPFDTTNFDQEKALKELREKIRGREQEAAGLVFDNIRSFERTTADRFLRIMEMGFGKSLGVRCTHCHNPGDWSSDEKPQKQIARDMMKMVGRINQELLPAINNLESERPIVNCTTCHRGQVKPALNINN